MEIEVGDVVAEFGMQMPSDALHVAHELPGAPRDVRKLGGADHQEGDNSDDQTNATERTHRQKAHAQTTETGSKRAAHPTSAVP